MLNKTSCFAVMVASSSLLTACGGEPRRGATPGRQDEARDQSHLSDDEAATIGGQFAEITRLRLVVNLYDGFMGPARNDVFEVDVSARTVSLNEARPVTATARQIRDLVRDVRQITYRDHQHCSPIFAIDGARFSPRLTVSSASASSTFGVSDDSCGKSDHAHVGNVMSCQSFDTLHRHLGSIVPGATAIDCASHDYW